MSELRSPAFGQADLTNCERELIHLAGSIQPHGILLVVAEPDLRIVQVSANVRGTWGVSEAELLGQPLSALRGDLSLQVERLAANALAEPVPLHCRTEVEGHAVAFEATLHRHPGGALIVELQPTDDTEGAQRVPFEQIGQALQRYAAASNINTLADAVAKSVRDMTGYDRVMVYKFDPDGHGKIIAEARDARLDSLLGHHYPASDIPQRARELYVRNRVRVLVDAHYVPVPLVPRLLPLTGAELDMSLCHLRSMSPLHTQYLKNMGVTATLVISLVREGRLWGLIAAHHYTPRKLPYVLKTATDLLAEVIATRISAIENYAHAQVAILVRRLEQRLMEATSSEGDWRLALFRHPATLLQPLEATGAALFHEGEILTSGDVPSTPELRALLAWVQSHAAAGTVKGDQPFACSSVGRENPALESVTPVASGVLAVRLSTSRPDYLMWFRKEQLTSVTWAGDPTKPVLGNDPLELSPRRSFAAWSEIVRGTAMPWTSTEQLLARALGTALADIIVQVHAVRLLIAEHQLTQTRATVENSAEPVLVADARGRLLFANTAFRELVGAAAASLTNLDDLARLFVDPESVAQRVRDLSVSRLGWRGEYALARAGDAPVPVGVRAEVVQGRDGSMLGHMLLFSDLRPSKRTQAARQHLENALALAARPDTRTNGRTDARSLPASDKLMAAILTNASLAAMDIADAEGTPSVAPLLEELESSTRRAALLYEQLRGLDEAT